MLVPQTLVLAKRMLLRWSRDLSTVLQTLIVPILLLVTLDTVLGRQITSISGHDALYGSVPMVAVVATISGSSVGAIGLIRERTDGLLARLWVLPVHRASGLLSRFVAEAVRILVTSVVILVAGMALGFRFEQGWLAALAWLAVPVVFGLAFATLVTAAAFYSATQRHWWKPSRWSTPSASSSARVSSHWSNIRDGFSRWSNTSRCRMPSTRCEGFRWAARSPGR